MITRASLTSFINKLKIGWQWHHTNSSENPNPITPIHPYPFLLMPLCAVFGHSISIPILNSKSYATTNKNRRWGLFCSTVAVSDSDDTKSRVVYDSLRVLEWDKLCHSVSSFACTSLGREATFVILFCFNTIFMINLLIKLILINGIII